MARSADPAEKRPRSSAAQRAAATARTTPAQAGVWGGRGEGGSVSGGCFWCVEQAQHNTAQQQRFRACHLESKQESICCANASNSWSAGRAGCCAPAAGSAGDDAAAGAGTAGGGASFFLLSGPAGLAAAPAATPALVAAAGESLSPSLRRRFLPPAAAFAGVAGGGAAAAAAGVAAAAAPPPPLLRACRFAFVAPATGRETQNRFKTAGLFTPAVSHGKPRTAGPWHLAAAHPRLSEGSSPHSSPRRGRPHPCSATGTPEEEGNQPPRGPAPTNKIAGVVLW